MKHKPIPNPNLTTLADQPVRVKDVGKIKPCYVYRLSETSEPELCEIIRADQQVRNQFLRKAK